MAKAWEKESSVVVGDREKRKPKRFEREEKVKINNEFKRRLGPNYVQKPS